MSFNPVPKSFLDVANEIKVGDVKNPFPDIKNCADETDALRLKIADKLVKANLLTPLPSNLNIPASDPSVTDSNVQSIRSRSAAVAILDSLYKLPCIKDNFDKWYNLVNSSIVTGNDQDSRIYLYYTFVSSLIKKYFDLTKPGLSFKNCLDKDIYSHTRKFWYDFFYNDLLNNTSGYSNNFSTLNDSWKNNIVQPIETKLIPELDFKTLEPSPNVPPTYTALLKKLTLIIDSMLGSLGSGKLFEYNPTFPAIDRFLEFLNLLNSTNPVFYEKNICGIVTKVNELKNTLTSLTYNNFVGLDVNFNGINGKSIINCILRICLEIARIIKENSPYTWTSNPSIQSSVDNYSFLSVYGVAISVFNSSGNNIGNQLYDLPLLRSNPANSPSLYILLQQIKTYLIDGTGIPVFGLHGLKYTLFNTDTGNQINDTIHSGPDFNWNTILALDPTRVKYDEKYTLVQKIRDLSDIKNVLEIPSFYVNTFLNLIEGVNVIGVPSQEFIINLTPGLSTYNTSNGFINAINYESKIPLPDGFGSDSKYYVDYSGKDGNNNLFAKRYKYFAELNLMMFSIYYEKLKSLLSITSDYFLSAGTGLNYILQDFDFFNGSTLYPKFTISGFNNTNFFVNLLFLMNNDLSTIKNTTYNNYSGLTGAISTSTLSTPLGSTSNPVFGPYTLFNQYWVYDCCFLNDLDSTVTNNALTEKLSSVIDNLIRTSMDTRRIVNSNIFKPNKLL